MVPGLQPNRQSSMLPRFVILLVGLALTIQIGFDLSLVKSTSPPVIDDGRDLLAFVTAGRIADDVRFGPESVYNPEINRRVQQELTGRPIPPGTGLPFIHPPYLLPVQRALAPLDYAEFWLRWSAIMGCLFFAGFLFLDGAFAQAGVSAPLRLMFGAVGVAFSPVVISLVQGQDTALLYLAVAVWLAAFAARRDFLAGLALSLATIRPHIALVLAIPFLFARRRVLAGFATGSVMLLGWFLVQVGPGGLQEYVQVSLGLAGGKESGVELPNWASLVGILDRLLPFSASWFGPVLGWGIWAGMLIGLCALWRRRNRTGGPLLLDLGIAVFLSLALAPHMNFHDMALLHVALAPALVVQAKRTSAHSGLWVLAGLLGISHLISLATVPNFLGRDLLIVASYGAALVILLRAGDGGAAAQGDSIGDRSIA
jgi:hypothetical protein